MGFQSRNCPAVRTLPQSGGGRRPLVRSSGIGLALVQELVRIHGGQIAVESEEGRGTVFRVRLPFGFAHLPADKIKAKGLQPGKRGRLCRGSVALASDASRDDVIFDVGARPCNRRRGMTRTCSSRTITPICATTSVDCSKRAATRPSGLGWLRALDAARLVDQTCSLPT